MTGEGVPQLLRHIVKQLDTLPEDQPDEELFVFRPLDEREDRSYTVSQVGPDTYRLAGDEIERLAAMTDWHN